MGEKFKKRPNLPDPATGQPWFRGKPSPAEDDQTGTNDRAIIVVIKHQVKAGRISRICWRPHAQIAAEILDELRASIDAYGAQTWLLSGQEVFAGKSAVMLIREGRADEVRAAVSNLKTRDLVKAKQDANISGGILCLS
jgi:hypothetical protein